MPKTNNVEVLAGLMHTWWIGTVSKRDPRVMNDNKERIPSETLVAIMNDQLRYMFETELKTEETDHFLIHADNPPNEYELVITIQKRKKGSEWTESDSKVTINSEDLKQD
jgi:hypothetical protein